jgi:pimeloyl-ACP methyl ester carboxylesterase
MVCLHSFANAGVNAKFELIESSDDYRCDLSGIQSTSVRVYPEQENSPVIDYKYQVVGSLDPDEIVIIHLPGGPGGSAINDFSIPEVMRRAVNAGLPQNIPWIMIDPRTVGCNKGDETIFPDDSLTSYHLAHDVLSVVKSLKLKKYIIHGHSYGSQSATFVAALAKSRGLPAAHAVVLSGVMGRGEKDGSFSIPSQLILEWNLIKATLSPQAQSILNQEGPLDVESDKWERFITSGLYIGFEYVEGRLRNLFLEQIRLLDSLDPNDHQVLKDILERPYESSPGQRDFSSRLFDKVDCHEYSPDDGGVVFDKGTLVYDIDNNPCAGEAFDRPYDSKTLQMDTSIYYISGENDPAAPYMGARYHFENQITSRRNFVTVPGGAHLRLGWVLPDCMGKVWDSIFKQEDLTLVIPQCEVKVKLEVI